MARLSPMIRLVVVVLLCMGSPFLYEYNAYSEYNYLLVLIGLLSLFLLDIPRRFRITRIDIAVVIYVTGALTNYLLVADHPADSAKIYQWAIVICVYLLIRMQGRTSRVIACTIIFSGFLQSLYGLFQQSGFFVSNDTGFDITGSFFNPGPYGGFLAVAFIASILTAYASKRRSLRFVLAGMAVVIGYALYLSDSRAGWLSVFVVLVVLGIVRMKRYRKVIVVLSVVLSLSAVFLLYRYKPVSADARLFIWKVSAIMAAERPLFGHGMASFPSEYLFYQADYFRQHPDAPEIRYAGNNVYAFNEFVRLACEQGIVGLLSFGFLLYACFRVRRKRIAKLGLLTLLVFSCFSYPSDVFPLMLLFALFIGTIGGSGRCFLFSIGPQIRYAMGGVLFVLIVLCGARWYKDRGFSSLLNEYYFDGTEASLAELSCRYPEFRNNHSQVRQYALIFYQDELYEQAYPALEDMLHIAPSAELLCDLGSVHEQAGRYVEAEQCYRTAADALPALIVPRYRLFCLYRDTGREEMAVREAEYILTMKVKVVNSTTIRIKAEIKAYLNPEGGVAYAEE